jgi:uncharacterized protein (DUF1697 family)
MEDKQNGQYADSRFVVLLRGINVSGLRSIRMLELRERLQTMGFTEVRTYLQSGNVVLQSVEQDSERLASQIRAMILSEFGHEVDVLVLSAQTLREMVQANPFAPISAEDGKLFHTTLLFSAMAERDFERLSLPVQEGERVQRIGQAIYLHCPAGYGKTKLNNSYFEKKLGIPATTRNWRSMLAILQMCT